MKHFFDVVKKSHIEVNQVSPNRSPIDIIYKLGEEFGELCEELAIHDGILARDRGPDGVLGEAVDLAIVVMDVVLLRNADLTIEDLDSFDTIFDDTLNDLGALYSSDNKWLISEITNELYNIFSCLQLAVNIKNNYVLLNSAINIIRLCVSIIVINVRDDNIKELFNAKVESKCDKWKSKHNLIKA